MERGSTAMIQANSLADRVYETLLEMILDGRLAPEERLHVDNLAADLGTSSTPLRDALSRLESDGLIQRRLYQGSFVRRFTLSETRDLYEFRVGLERYSARLACQRITGERLAKLRGLQDVGGQALDSGDTRAYLRYNQELHRTIIEAADNALLIAAARMNELQLSLLLRQSVRVEGASRRAIQEHEELVEHIAVGNADAAEDLVERHILRALMDLEALDASTEASPSANDRAARDNARENLRGTDI